MFVLMVFTIILSAARKNVGSEKSRVTWLLAGAGILM
jgi:hypothetical protein